MALDPAEIHYGIRGQKFGPVDLHTLVERIRAGQLSAEDYVWDEDSEDWVPLQRYAVLMASLGEELPTEIEPDDPRLKPLPASHPSVAPPVASLVPAGFVLRLLAFIIDDFVLAIPMAAWVFAVNAWTGVDPMSLAVLLERMADNDPDLENYLRMLTAGSFVIRGIYHVLLETSPWQATLGKRALGIVVTDENGARLGPVRAIGRHLGRLLCQFTFFIGYLMVIFTERGQGLHDRVAGTLVVRRPR